MGSLAPQRSIPHLGGPRAHPSLAAWPSQVPTFRLLSSPQTKACPCLRGLVQPWQPLSFISPQPGLPRSCSSCHPRFCPSCLLTHGCSGLALPCLCVILLVVAGAEAQEGSLHVLAKRSPAHSDHQLTFVHICKASGSGGQRKPCLCMGSLYTVCSMGSPFSREMEAARDKLRALFTPRLSTSLARASCPALSGFKEPELQLAVSHWITGSSRFEGTGGGM